MWVKHFNVNQYLALDERRSCWTPKLRREVRLMEHLNRLFQHFPSQLWSRHWRLASGRWIQRKHWTEEENWEKDPSLKINTLCLWLIYLILYYRYRSLTKLSIESKKRINSTNCSTLFFAGPPFIIYWMCSGMRYSNSW